LKDLRPIIGITLGDAAGIAPEVVIKALESPEIYRTCRPVVVGDARIVQYATRFASKPLQIKAINAVQDGEYKLGTVDVYDIPNLAPEDYEVGKTNASCGQAFVEYIRATAQLALRGEIEAIASAPTNKEAMHAAGHKYAGQTEVFAEAAGTKDFFTVLTGGNVKVFLLSSHVSLRKAIEMVTQERLESVIRVARTALHEIWGITRPKIAIAGLNPHAGDGGLFGQEEIEEVIPVVKKLQAEGFDLVGPAPSDSLYYSAEQGAYDGVIGMYHDQGVIPLKRYGYVTVIAGTPFIRTTAGHGTAYDIANKGVANPDVMKRAILLAAELAMLKRQSPRPRES
jgi:4-phospho-D-threonate 3-dehydrogenase / 4-phospho-D-erythronate 3-dehydrogenase